jgi:hypothetical protein
MLAHEGRSAPYIAAMMGHSLTDTQRHYAHLIDDARLATGKPMVEAIREACAKIEVRPAYAQPVKRHLEAVGVVAYLQGLCESGRRDLNSRPPAPKAARSVIRGSLWLADLASSSGSDGEPGLWARRRCPPLLTTSLPRALASDRRTATSSSRLSRHPRNARTPDPVGHTRKHALRGVPLEAAWVLDSLHS